MNINFKDNKVISFITNTKDKIIAKIKEEKEEEQELAGINRVDPKREIVLIDILFILKYWQQDVLLFINNTYQKVNLSNLKIKGNGYLYIFDDSIEEELGLAKDLLFVYDYIKDEILPLDLNQVVVYTKVKIQGVKLTQDERDTFNENVFDSMLEARKNEKFLRDINHTPIFS